MIVLDSAGTVLHSLPNLDTVSRYFCELREESRTPRKIPVPYRNHSPTILRAQLLYGDVKLTSTQKLCSPVAYPDDLLALFALD